MFDLFNRMENLLTFLEVLGYIAIALMVLQIFLTLGVMVCKSKSSDDASIVSPNYSFKPSNRESTV